MSLPEGDGLHAADQDLGVLPDGQVGENGLKLGPWLRVGWEKEAPYSPPPGVAAAPLRLHSTRPVSPPKRWLTCKSLGSMGAAPPLWDEKARAALFDRAIAPKPLSGSTSTRWISPQHQRLVTRFRERVSDASPRKPAQWIIQWIDPRDPRGEVRTWTGSPPPDADRGAFLTHAVGAGRRALFHLKYPGPSDGTRPSLPSYLVVINEKGEHRIQRVEYADDTRALTMSDAPGDPIVLSTSKEVFVWEADGSLKRFLGTTNPGVPKGARVPLLVLSNQQAFMRVLSVDPAEDQPEARGLPLDAWRLVPASYATTKRLSACGPKPAGASFEMRMNHGLGLVIDGQALAQGSLSFFYDIRIDGDAGCIAGIDMFAGGEPRSRALGFITADLIAGRGHSIETGKGGRVRQLSCALE